MALADVGAQHEGQTRRNHEVVRDPVRGIDRRHLDRLDAVRVDVLCRRVDELLVGQAAEPGMLVRRGEGRMALLVVVAGIVLIGPAPPVLAPPPPG